MDTVEGNRNTLFLLEDNTRERETEGLNRSLRQGNPKQKLEMIYEFRIQCGGHHHHHHQHQHINRDSQSLSTLLNNTRHSE